MGSRQRVNQLESEFLKDIHERHTYIDRSALVGTEGFFELRSMKDVKADVQRMRLEIGSQAYSSVEWCPTQTSRSRKVNSSSQTAPVTLLPGFHQSIQSQNDFLLFVHTICDRVTPILDSNVSSDVFGDQLSSLVASDDSLVKSFGVSQLKDARFNSSIHRRRLCSIVFLGPNN